MLNINLGYDYRITGDQLRDYQNKYEISMRNGLLESSFDVNVCPSVFCLDGMKSEPYEIAMQETLFDNDHFKTFDLFKSDSEAVSFYAKPADSSRVGLFFYKAILLNTPLDVVVSSWMKAISSNQVLAPEDFTFDAIGFELMDETFTSVTHLYYDISAIKGMRISPQNLEEIQKKMNNKELFLVQIFRATDGWWFS